jgi:hypothetical protein
MDAALPKPETCGTCPHYTRGEHTGWTHCGETGRRVTQSTVPTRIFCPLRFHERGEGA